MTEPHLKPETCAFLEGICFASNITWTEAGMGFKLVVDQLSEGDPISAELRERPSVCADHDAPLRVKSQVRKLARFLIGSIGGNIDRTPNSSETEMANTVVLRLHSDLSFDWFYVDIDECDFGMDMKLQMGIECSNKLATLHMSWRID